MAAGIASVGNLLPLLGTLDGSCRRRSANTGDRAELDYTVETREAFVGANNIVDVALSELHCAFVVFIASLYFAFSAAQRPAEEGQ